MIAVPATIYDREQHLATRNQVLHQLVESLRSGAPLDSSLEAGSPGSRMRWCRL